MERIHKKYHFFCSGLTLLFPSWTLCMDSLTKQGQLINTKAESFTGSKIASIYRITF